ncbi:MAG TPA: DUF2007 domain-containing protein [Candidatus Angelobacter sp.]|nr:DUF2007 domain-containing protein [Candidatus Angelobacter sp.]
MPTLSDEIVRANPPRLLWIGGRAAEFDAVAGALREANIPALVEEGPTRILQRFLNSESQICVLQSDLSRALEAAVNAVASLADEGERSDFQKCFQCGSACSAALTVCPKCAATLILERAPDKKSSNKKVTPPLSASKYCPLCHTEYAATYQHCTVCGVELVPEEMRGRPLGERELQEKMAIVWRGGDPATVSNVVSLLRSAGILHHVESTHDHFVFELAIPRPRYVVRILEKDLERARELLGNITDSPFFGAEISADFPQEVAPYVRQVVGRWNPAAATAEIWTGDDAALSHLLEDCLRENKIGFRREGLAPGPLHLFVTKTDEPRALEILREVREGTPPS